ncbi:MAG TPA: SpvB/TcaC N-terminal domain-containing protein, partial [Solirubrobacteraceae bacterium]|nr:SpvB/TcaC N-terminal domain-containing protein [Solirubrobacteraceae bacterium]
MRGLGETLEVSAATGSGSLEVPLDLSRGRAGFGPSLALRYDSGAGNGPFGLGWTLPVPAISRRTDRGVPRYHDDEESDVFLLAGGDDLVPVLDADGTRSPDTATAPGFRIDRYRPRLEEGFARLERWTHLDSGESHWRSIGRDNVTTLYGTSDESRIQSGGRVFSWLIVASYDDRGNAVAYSYVAEDATGVDLDRPSERTRTRTANRYLKRIRYGNRTPVDAGADLAAAEWLFEVVLDYGERHYEPLPPDPELAPTAQHRRVRVAAATPPGTWARRPDSFST